MCDLKRWNCVAYFVGVLFIGGGGAGYELRRKKLKVVLEGVAK